MGIKEIAAQCGVSPSTVSRVLRGVDPKCASERVRDRIWHAAQAMGYTADPIAQALRQPPPASPPVRIAILLGRTLSVEENHFFRALAYSAMAEILKNGCTLMDTVSIAENSDTLSCVADAAAAILIGRCSDGKMESVHARFPKLIYVGSSPALQGIDQVICSGYDAAVMAVTRLIRSGHTRIAYVGGYELSQRYQGFRDTMGKNGLPIQRRLVFCAEGIGSSIRSAARAIHAMAEPPTAIFCNNDHHAVELVTALRKLRPAHPLPALISIEDTDMAESCSPSLSSIHIPAEEMGRMAVRLLLDRMHMGHREAVQLTFPCRYVERESFRQGGAV